MNIKDRDNFIESLAIAFTVVDETMPSTPKELKKDLVRFAKEVVNKLTIPVVVNQRELLLKKQSDWLMLHTKLEVENIVSFTEEFKQ
jgi:hypothetical protein